MRDDQLQPCGHPKSRIKKARSNAEWCYWCGECVKQALAATSATQDTNADSDRSTGRSVQNLDTTEATTEDSYP